MSDYNEITNNKVMFLSPKQLKRALILLWKAQVPAAIIGGPGCGKTTAVQEVIKDLNDQRHPDSPEYKLWPVILSYKAPEDIGGVPYPNKDKTKVTYLMPEDIPFGSEEYGIIFGDEFDRAGSETQNSFLQVLLGGSIHNNNISPNSYTILALNGISDIYTTKLSGAAITRVCTLFVSSAASDYLTSYDEWADGHNISPMMRSFAKYNKELLKDFNDFEELAMPTPRTRDMADRVLKVADSTSFKTDDIILPIISGIVGKATAVQLMAFKNLCDKLPDPEDIIKNPDTVVIPVEINIQYAMVCSVINFVKDCDDIDTADKIVSFGVRLPDEMAAALFYRLGKKCPDIITNTKYSKWADEHKFILNLE